MEWRNHALSYKILALKRQKDCHEFKASLGYPESLRLAWATSQSKYWVQRTSLLVSTPASPEDGISTCSLFFRVFKPCPIPFLIRLLTCTSVLHFNDIIVLVTFTSPWRNTWQKYLRSGRISFGSQCQSSSDNDGREDSGGAGSSSSGGTLTWLRFIYC